MFRAFQKSIQVVLHSYRKKITIFNYRRVVHHNYIRGADQYFNINILILPFFY